MHCSTAQSPIYPLHVAMASTSPSDFLLEVIEPHIQSDKLLARREKELIAKHDTIWPNGLNGNSGGAIGGGKPQPVIWDGEKFRSITERNKALGKRHSLEPYVVANRIRNDISLNNPQRRVAEDRLPDPDSQRKWLKLVRLAKRGKIELDDRWKDPAVWAEDLQPERHRHLHLVRLDSNAPYGPENVKWMTEKEKIEHIHGKTIRIHGTLYPNLHAASTAFNVKESTLKNRINDQNMTPEEAVASSSGITSAKETLFEGETFSSLHQAAKILCERHRISHDKARDRIRRNFPTTRWKHM